MRVRARREGPARADTASGVTGRGFRISRPRTSADPPIFLAGNPGPRGPPGPTRPHRTPLAGRGGRTRRSTFYLLPFRLWSDVLNDFPCIVRRRAVIGFLPVECLNHHSAAGEPNVKRITWS